MKAPAGLLKRRSVIAFIIICLAGLFAPLFAGGYPSDAVGAPFARPVWWNRALSSTREFTVDTNGISFDWDKLPPALFKLNGTVEGEDVRIIFVSPEKEFEIARLDGKQKQLLNIDARDMIFKQQLGLPLVGNATEQLFPCKGKYSLKIEGASRADLLFSLPGARQGLLGTDQRGRDVFALFLYGIRTSLLIGIIATLVASVLGLGFGLAAGYAGGWTDAVIMRTVDILLSIPTMPILMILAGVWGKGLWQIVVTISLFSWMGTARSVRSLVLSVRESQWIEGLKALGAKRSYILVRHLIPETAPIMLANLALGVPGAILSEAALAFFGLSDPRLISWGRMLHAAHSFGAFTEGAWWLLLPPGLGIVAVCLIFMDIGRYLEEQIDPRLSGEKKNA